MGTVERDRWCLKASEGIICRKRITRRLQNPCAIFEEFGIDSVCFKYPAISSVLLPLYLLLMWLLARRYLRSTDAKAIEGVKLGAVIFLVTIILDALVYVVLLGGADYFAYLSIWVAYALFVFVPWFVGRQL